jgi:hypothetical protein
MSPICLWCYSLGMCLSMSKKKSSLLILINGHILGNYHNYNYSQIKYCVQYHFANISKVIWYERVIFIFSCLTFGSHLFIG